MAETKRENGIDFPSQAFAFVPDPEKTSTWKLRLWSNLEEKETPAQVGAAAAALSPGGFRGNRVQLPADQVESVKSKVRAVWLRVNSDKEPEEMPESIKKLSEEKKEETFTIESKEIFATGKWNGDEYTGEDLKDMEKAFNDLDFKPALKITHDLNEENKKIKNINPALGYVSNLRIKGKKLVGDFTDMPKKVFQAVKNKAYNRVSAEIGWNYTRNGTKHRRALLAVSLLGSEIPAVANLEQLNALYSEKDCEAIKSYELDVEESGIIKEYIHDGMNIPWEDTATSFIYWIRPRSSVVNPETETIQEGVVKWIDQNKDVVAYEFMKDSFTIKTAKKWVSERLTSFTNNFKEKDMPEKKENKEKVPTIEELQKELADANANLETANTKLETVNTEKTETEKKLSDKEAEVKKNSETLELQMESLNKKNEATELVLKELQDKNVKLEVDARDKEVKEFIEAQKREGKIVPAQEASLIAILTETHNSEKICKYGEGDSAKEISLHETVKNFVSSLGKTVEFKEVSKTDNVDLDPGIAFSDKVTEVSKRDKINFNEAWVVTSKEFPGLLKAYKDNRN